MTFPTAGLSQEEATAPITLDSARVNVLYRSIIQCRSFFTGDLVVTDKTASAPFIARTIEQTGHQLEFASGLVSIPTISSALATFGLELVVSSRSPMPVIDLDSMITIPTYLVASTLISMKTPPRLLPVYFYSVMLMAAPVTPSTIMTMKLIEIPSSKLTRSSGVIKVEKEFVVEMIDTFYKSLKRGISLVLKGSTSPFEFMKVVLT